MRLFEKHSTDRVPSLSRTLAGTAAAVAATAMVGRFATEPSGLWYRQLKKPAWQPPAVAFPLVWGGLYAGIAVTAAAAMHRLADRTGPDSAAVASYRKAFAANLVLNGAWSVLFWRGRNLSAATVESAVLTLSSADLARRSGSVDPVLGLALVPYVTWTGFATVLAGTLAMKNR